MKIAGIRKTTLDTVDSQTEFWALYYLVITNIMFITVSILLTVLCILHDHTNNLRTCFTLSKLEYFTLFNYICVN